MPESFIQNIEGVDYIRTIYSDRLEILIPESGWEEITRTFNLRKNLINSNVAHICSRCEDENENNLDAHHIVPVKYLVNDNGHTYQDPNGDHSISNGTWLCRSCHNKLHHSLTK